VEKVGIGSNTPSSVPGVFLNNGDYVISKQRTLVDHSRSISSKEVVASLFGSKLANRGQHTERIASQHNDIARLAINDTRNLGVRNELDRVRATSVLGNVDIVIIRRAVCGVVDHVLEDGAEPDGVENFGFLFCGKVDALGVAPSFDVEDTSVGPNVFVVTDKETVGVSGKGCLSGAGETEEESDVTVLHANVGRRMK